MNRARHNEVLLQLILTRPQARPLIDLLLAQPDSPFFTVANIQGHGQPAEQLSLQEQVAGAQHKVCIDVEIDHGRLDNLLAEIHNHLTTETIFYRVIPVLRQGCLGADGDTICPSPAS